MQLTYSAARQFDALAAAKANTVASLEAAATLVIRERTHGKHNHVYAPVELELTGRGIELYPYETSETANGRRTWLVTDAALLKLKAKYSSLTKPRAEYMD
jgi:hypothetical protein